MADSTDTAPPDEPEEEEVTLESEEEGDGEKEKKKKKDPFAGLLAPAGGASSSVSVKFNLAGRKAVPTADIQQRISSGGN